MRSVELGYRKDMLDFASKWGKIERRRRERCEPK